MPQDRRPRPGCHRWSPGPAAWSRGCDRTRAVWFPRAHAAEPAPRQSSGGMASALASRPPGVVIRASDEEIAFRTKRAEIDRFTSIAVVSGHSQLVLVARDLPLDVDDWQVVALEDLALRDRHDQHLLHRSVEQHERGIVGAQKLWRPWDVVHPHGPGDRLREHEVLALQAISRRTASSGHRPAVRILRAQIEWQHPRPTRRRGRKHVL